MRAIEKQIMGSEDIRRALTRIAHEIVERHKGVEGLVFVGLLTRGVPLAERLSRIIDSFEKSAPPVARLDIGFYRDDIPYRFTPPVRPTSIPFSLDGKRVVLVDDVLFTGRSIRAALDALMDFGRPRKVSLAVLVDRGHRELPIRADYVGKNVPTSRHEEVQVRLTETDGRDEVVIIRQEGER